MNAQVKNHPVAGSVNADEYLQREPSISSDTQFHNYEIYSQMTGTSLGYLGSQNNWVRAFSERKDSSGFAWYLWGGNTYFLQNASPSNRYLGGIAGAPAACNLWARAAELIFNADGTISLKGSPMSKLYYFQDGYLSWSSGEYNQNIVYVKKLENS